MKKSVKAELVKQGKIKRDKQESFIYKNTSDNRHYENVGGKVVDIENDLPFAIPSSWAWCRIKEIFLVNPRNNIDDNLDVAFIPMPLINAGFANVHGQEKRKWNEIKTGFTHFAEGDVGVAKITPSSIGLLQHFIVTKICLLDDYVELSNLSNQQEKFIVFLQNICKML